MNNSEVRTKVVNAPSTTVVLAANEFSLTVREDGEGGRMFLAACRDFREMKDEAYAKRYATARHSILITAGYGNGEPVNFKAGILVVDVDGRIVAGLSPEGEFLGEKSMRSYLEYLLSAVTEELITISANEAFVQMVINETMVEDYGNAVVDEERLKIELRNATQLREKMEAEIAARNIHVNARLHVLKIDDNGEVVDVNKRDVSAGKPFGH